MINIRTGFLANAQNDRLLLETMRRNGEIFLNTKPLHFIRRALKLK